MHLVTRTDAATIARDGLTLRDRQGERKVEVASARPTTAGLGPCDFAIVAAKATANPTLPDQLRPLLGPRTILVTLQNGMGNVEAFADLLPGDRLVAGLCFVCINRLGPGVVENTLAGNVRMAASQGPATRPSPPPWRSSPTPGSTAAPRIRWSPSSGKSFAGTSPSTAWPSPPAGSRPNRIVGDPALRVRARRLMDEVAAAAAARGHGFEEKHIRWQLEMTDGMGPYRPSSLIDYLAGRRWRSRVSGVSRCAAARQPA